ncbi:alanine aminotransferase 1 [Nilaparvata lugens]|uniref:alanine aminotransferase 1 n=1 Tax=Nilaparvata lugens TaxID=108931 RepID=UPI00193CA70F|nr:alanine aminotransferase 1 [Nilaparvata lugens]
MASKFLNLSNTNRAITETEFPVSRIHKLVAETEESFVKGTQKYDFEEIIRADIGVAQDPDHGPITFARQMMALACLPALRSDPMFPSDVKSRVEQLLNDCPGRGLGSYVATYGIEGIRKHVAEFIERRDGHPSNYENIYLCSGSDYILRHIIQAFAVVSNGKPSGVLTPIPGPPQYSWTITQHRMKPVSYNLKYDDNGWSIDVDELKRTLDESRKFCCPRVILINNPGNPAGQILTKQNIEDIIKFAYNEKLFIIADEVYQNNIYSDEKEFVSFKKVLCDLGSPYDGMQMASVMSTSKGYLGECGARGGYFELLNVDAEERYVLYKLLSSNTCPNVAGQIYVESLVNPPRKGDPSYELFINERNKIMSLHKSKIELITENLKGIKGISSIKPEGAPYIFAQMEVPPKAVKEAERQSICPSEMYTTKLLRSTGICVSPGLIFGQIPGRYFFRMSALLPKSKLRSVVARIQEFHESFLLKYK